MENKSVFQEAALTEKQNSANSLQMLMSKGQHIFHD